MIAARTIWSILRRHVPRKQWVSSGDIYAIVETHGKLEGDDFRPASHRSKTPQWKTRVRSVLMNRIRKGRVRCREGSSSSTWGTH